MTEHPLEQLLADTLPCNDGTTDHDWQQNNWNPGATRCLKCGFVFEVTA